MVNNPIEPSAAMRGVARFAFEHFTALVEAGFKEHQAIAMTNNLVSEMLRAAGSTLPQKDADGN